MSERPMFYLIDGHALAYRQFFGLPVAGFTTRAGEPTNATYGFARLLLDILQHDCPQYLAVSFDMGLSGRDELYGEYKGTREKMPEELQIQMKRIDQLVKAFNVPVLALEGYEADDVIGTVVGQAEAQGVDIRIITGDRDILQLLTPHVTVQLPARGSADVVYDEQAFREKYGLEPRQLVDLKALMGDSSDNIPGVRGIGEKTATKLLQQYGSLDAIYEHIDEIKGAVRRKLEDGREMAYLSRELATIRRDVPITLDLEACVARDYDHPTVAELFRELEFRSLTDRLNEVSTEIHGAEVVQTDADFETVIVRDAEALDALIHHLRDAKAITFDVETTSTDQMQAELVGIALSTDGQRGYYIPVGHRQMKQPPLFDLGDDQEAPLEQLPLQQVIDALQEALTSATIPKYAHNAVYDLVVLQRYGLDVSPIEFDTMVAEWVLDPLSKFLGLKNLVRQRLGIQMTAIDELLGKGRNQITMDLVSIEDTAPYAAADAVYTHRLVEILRKDLEAAGLMELYNTLEIPFIPVLADLEQAGVLLDTPYLEEFSQRLADMLAEYEREIYALSGGYGEFNINSPKQLNDVLFGKLGLPVAGLRKTTHGYSTDAATLEALRDEHPIIPVILQYREVAKLKSTYVDALPQLVNPQTGRLHTSYNQTGTSTGRLSSSDPNLQNIPIRTELGREVRRAFIAAKGHKLLSVDYSQVELRVLAHISQDATLLEAFRQGQDIHRATAAAVYGIPIDEVTYEQRSFAKRVNFGLIYGMGAYRLARDSDLTLAQAREFIETYFARMPGVERYIEETKRQAREQGYVTTLFGRRGEFRALQSAQTRPQVAQALERAAINMPIQGSAADILKRAMIDLHHALNAKGYRAKMILQVHDELVLEVPDDELDEVATLTVEIMEAAYPLDAPLVANAAVGTNWRDMEELARS